jgi:outer membrane protein TolC
MHRQGALALLLAAAALAAPAFATPSGAESVRWAGPLTLAQAVARVESDGFDTRMSLAQAGGAAADAAAMRATSLPQIGISGTATDANLPQLGMMTARQTYASANISVPLLNPSAWANARAASLDASAAQQEVETARNDAAFAVVQAYHRAQLADGLVEVRTAAVRDQEEHLRLTSQRVDVGKAPRYFLARDGAALAASQQMLEDANAERDRSLTDLAALLNFEMDAPPAIADALVPWHLAEGREVWLGRAEQRPDVAVMRSRWDAARTRIGAASASYAPTLALSGQTYNGSSNPALGAAGGQIAATVSLPILDGGTRSAAFHRARADAERARIDYERTKTVARRDALDAWRDYEAAQRNLTTAESARLDAQEQLRVARLRESVGKAIELEILDALAVAANARETALRALARYDDAIAAVQHAVGNHDFAAAATLDDGATLAPPTARDGRSLPAANADVDAASSPTNTK